MWRYEGGLEESGDNKGRLESEGEIERRSRGREVRGEGKRVCNEGRRDRKHSCRQYQWFVEGLADGGGFLEHHGQLEQLGATK